MHIGKVIKAISGFFYVDYEGQIYECKGKGKLKKDKIIPFVGDDVEFEVINDKTKKGIIEKVLERENSLVRPPVSNVDQVVIVFAIKNPTPNYLVLDKIIAIAESKGVEVTICINKIDLDDTGEYEKFYNRYKNVGYEVFKLSATSDNDLKEKLMPILKGKTSVFSGPSGVGKSTILNTLHKDIEMETGEISEKLKRGKHTTRHVELFSLDKDTFVLDTPGFTSLEVYDIDKEDLRYSFVEFLDYSDECKYSTCIHISEPNCKVKEALEENKISKERYNNYISIYNEINDKRRK
ncbi:MAG: ribosome small subunit-dependent GTPase A [Clostridia bacterium]|jgi:ribosome biogenesis GTPase|nr:ribosome small subunit-dependent GTPase A [Clostridia bacterium]